MKANQISDYEKVQIIEKRERIKSVNTGRITLVFVAVLLIFAIFGGYFFVKSNWVGEKTYYMLILDTATTTQKAQEISESIAKAGGSGYIINDGEFKIAGALYATLTDAEQVAGRIKNSFPNAQILPFNLGRKRVDKTIKPFLDYADSLLEYLIAQSINLDLLNISEGNLLLNLNEERAKMNEQIKSLQNALNQNPTNTQINSLLEFYNIINENWSYVGSLESDLGVYNHRIKYFTCLLVSEYTALRFSL